MTTPSPITVAISRFDDLLALGLGAALASDPNVRVVARDVAPDRLDVVLRATAPQVGLIDLGGLPRLARVRELRLAHPHTRLVLLGHGLSGVDSAQLLAFGASACLARDTQARDLLNAIYLASRGMQLQLMPVTARATVERSSLLTPREGDVLLLLRQNRANAQIALELHVSIETVRSHARNIYRKLGVSSRRALLALPASRAGVGEAPSAV